MVLDELQALGSRLKEKIRSTGFHWEGFGTIFGNTHTIPVSTGALEAVPAQRVIRHDARHKVLVGDQQVLSGQPPETEISVVKKVRKTSLLMIIGWAVLFLSIIAIAILIYMGKFRINSTGSKQAPTSYQVFSKRLIA